MLARFGTKMGLWQYSLAGPFCPLERTSIMGKFMDAVVATGDFALNSAGNAIAVPMAAIELVTTGDVSSDTRDRAIESVTGIGNSLLDDD